MKRLLFLFAFVLCVSGFSQEKFKHKYRLKKNIKLTYRKTVKKLQKELEGKIEGTEEYKKIQAKIANATDHKKLQKDKIFEFKDLSEKEQKVILNKITLVKDNLTEYVELTALDGTKLIVNKEQANNPYLTKKVGLSKSEDAVIPNCRSCTSILGWDLCSKKCKGNVLFEEDKLYFNIWHIVGGDYTDDAVPTYYQLKDGQTIKLNFEEITITTLALPLKYRFRDDPIMVPSLDGENEPILDDQMQPVTERRDIPETFTTGINISLFGGYTFGSTKFNRRIKVKNREIVRKHTLGALLGTGTETINKANTDGTENAPQGSEENTIGLASVGLGYVYSRNKLALGIFFGWDFGVGSISNTWNYDNRPWIGVGLGYDIFKL